MKPAILKLLQERYFLENETEWDDIAKRVSVIYPPIYEHIRDMDFIPSSPTLMNANTNGERQGTLSSCFPMGIEDSIEGICDATKECALVTKAAGGVGYDFSVIRGSGEIIKSLNRETSGPLPFAKIMNSFLDGISQGGCLTKDSYISTDKGLFRFDELLDMYSKEGWNEHSIVVKTEKGEKNSTKFFVNGIEPLKEIVLSNGFTIKGTNNHKLKVMTAEGEMWKRFDELQHGDWVIQVLDTYSGTTHELIFPSITHFNQKEYTLPKTIDKEFAFLLGYMMGNGFVASKETDYRVGFSVPNKSYLIEELPKIITNIFGEVKLLVMEREGDDSKTFVITSKYIKEFLNVNNISKSKSINAKIPCIIRSSQKDIVWAYLTGLFEADGSIVHGFPVLISSSKQLVNEVGILLQTLGIRTKIRKNKKHNSFSTSDFIYEVKVITHDSLEKWNFNTFFDTRSRFVETTRFKFDVTREKNGVIPFAEYFLKDLHIYLKTVKSKTKERKQISRYYNWKDSRNFSVATVNRLSKEIPEWDSYVSIDKNINYSQVEYINEIDADYTYDIEVDETHSYIANSILSHNSRKGAGMAQLDIDHKDILSFIRVKDNKDELLRMNLSVRISDEFYETLKSNPNSIHMVKFNGGMIPLIDNGKKVTTKQLWDEITYRAWKNAEPGIFNKDIATRQCTVTNVSNHVASNP